MLVSQKEWLALRKQGIGGSDCSAILGLNPYMTNVDLFEYKTGKKEQPDISLNENVIFGREHEFLLVEQFFDENKDKYDVLYKGYPIKEYLTKFPNGNDEVDIKFSERKPFMFASLDGELIDKNTGEYGVLEIKTCQINTYNRSKWKNNKIPNNYYCQVLHYLAVTNYSFAVVYAMLRYKNGEDEDEEYKTFVIKKEDKKNEIDYLETVEEKFWTENVLKNSQPDLIINV